MMMTWPFLTTRTAEDSAGWAVSLAQEEERQLQAEEVALLRLAVLQQVVALYCGVITCM